jgi:hypothetical protein
MRFISLAPRALAERFDIWVQAPTFLVRLRLAWEALRMAGLTNI